MQVVKSAIKETIGRRAILAMASTYPGMTEALLELIDNPFDYRRGEPLNIEVMINRRKGTIVVLDYGGGGMDEEDLRDWIQWGTGHDHSSDDIGQYHVGGKLAAIHLAKSLEIVCRKAGAATSYRLCDPQWGTRTETFEGSAEILDNTALAWLDSKLAELPSELGFTKFTLKGLKQGRRYEPAIVQQRLANVYKYLLETQDCRISVDGQDVTPLQIPESITHEKHVVIIDKTRIAPGVFVRGRIWVMDRDRIPTGRGIIIKAGIRTLFNGRLITEGETFGHNLSGKGALQRLIGELHINGISPTTNKDNWLKDSPTWALIEELIHNKMNSLVSILNAGDSMAITRNQRKRTERIRRELDRALKKLNRSAAGASGRNGHQDLPSGRRPAVPGLSGPETVKNKDATTDKRGIVNRTSPPSLVVGNLVRRVGQKGIPSIEYADLGKVERSKWGDANRTSIVINTSYPLYEEESDPYVVETILLHMLSDDESFIKAPLSRTMEELDRVLWAWNEER